MSYTKNVITEIKQKTSNGFSESIPIGAKQKNIEALLNSNNNNLEEQLLFGADFHATITQDAESGSYTVVKKFYNEDQGIPAEGYYILSSTDSSNVYCKPTVEVSGAIARINPPTLSSFVLLNDNLDLTIYYENGEIQADDDYVDIRTETLAFRADISNTENRIVNSDIIILTKTISKKVDDNGIIHYRQSIVNNLAD